MAMDLRVLLVNAINPHVEVERRYPNLGLGYLVSSVRQAFADQNINLRIIDSKVASEADQFCPHLVGISSVSQNFTIARNYADFFAERSVPVILGGVHISALPTSMPRNVVAACLGEGEQTFVDIIRTCLDEGLCPDNMVDIPGIAYWEDDKLHVTRPRPLIAELDSLPMPARDLLHIRPHTYMFTSRGCPYRCRFCASSRFWDNVRFFSAEYVVNEIELLVRKYDAKMISFFDDLFVAERSRLEEIVRLLEKRKILSKVKFTTNCRANVIDEELVGLLSRMGIVSVGMGLESGDDDILHYLKGNSVNVEDNYKAINYLKKAGISANASFVIGSPPETRKQIMKTYDFIRQSNLDLFDVYLLTPFPGTPIWEYAIKKGLLDNDMEDWSCLDVNLYRAPEKVIFLSEVLEKEELIVLYKKFRRLRFRRNLFKVWKHPMLRDLPGMAWKLFLEKVVELKGVCT